MERFDLDPVRSGDTVAAKVFTVTINDVAAAITAVAMPVYLNSRLVKTYSSPDDITIASGAFTLNSHVMDLSIGAYIYGAIVTLSDGSIRTWFGGQWNVLEVGKLVGKTRPYIPINQVFDVVGGADTSTPVLGGDTVTITVNESPDSVAIAVSTGGGLQDPTTTAGDLIYRDSGNVLTRLPKGANGQVVGVDGSGNVGYITPSGSGDLLSTANLSDLSNIATARTNLGLEIGTDVQAYSAILQATTASFTTVIASQVTANNAKVTNATHTGDVTGDGALTIQPTAITGKTEVTPVAGDKLLLVDATDGALKSADATSFLTGGGGATNLAYIAAPTQGTVTSDTGTDATITVTDGTNAGLFLPAEKTKLTGIEAGAEVNNISDINATDLTDGGDSTLHFHATDRDRANHTGTQAIATVTGLQAALDSKLSAETDPVFSASQAANITAQDITNLGNLSGTNTGDQDLSGYALLTSVLTRTNTDVYTPTTDYHPATKKYVDDAIVGGGGYTDEQAQDAVGTILLDTATINFTYDDATRNITADLNMGSISEAFLNASTNASLDLADSALQPTAIGVSIQAYSAVLDGTTASFTTADQIKLDGIETNATADQTPSEIKTAYESNANTNAFTDAEQSKLLGIEAGADVTDTANVTAAGALMDSEVDADIKTLSLPANTTISTFGASLVDDLDAATARTTLGVDAAGTDNSTDVTLAGAFDYLTITGQVITRNAIDLTTDVTGVLPLTNVATITESDISDLGTAIALVADNLSVFAATTSAQLAGVISDETGTGSLVFAEAPTLNDAVYNGSQSSALGTTPAPNIDLGTGVIFTYAMAGNVTFTLSNIPSNCVIFELWITYTSGIATWTNFTNLLWDGGTAPSFTTGHVYTIAFSTADGGANWKGQVSGDFS